MIPIWSHCGPKLGDPTSREYDHGKDQKKGVQRGKALLSAKALLGAKSFASARRQDDITLRAQMNGFAKQLLLLLLALIVASSGFAGGRAHSSRSSSATVNVSGYYRKDGTYVAPYVRRAPGTATDSATATSVSGGGGVTLAERFAAQNSTADATSSPRIEVKDEALPKASRLRPSGQKQRRKRSG